MNDYVQTWGTPPKPRKGRKSKYVDRMETVKKRWQAGDRETYGVVGSFATARSASSAAHYLREKFEGFIFKSSPNPDGSDSFVVWARWDPA